MLVKFIKWVYHSINKTPSKVNALRYERAVFPVFIIRK